MEEFNADGFDISWTRTSMDRFGDSELLASFLSELKLRMSAEKQLIVSVTPYGTVNKRYNIPNLNRFFTFSYNLKFFSTADHIIIQGYRFHSYDKLFTGHHSPLFVSEILTEPTYTIEGIMREWYRQYIPPEKLVSF